MKKLFKFIGVLLILVGILSLIGVGLIKLNDWPVYVRSPKATLKWRGGEDSGRGNVYWKPFSEEYVAEIDQGAGLYLWAGIDREARVVTFPRIPNRLLGLVLISRGELDPAPPDEELDPVSDWRYAFSKSMVTFANGRYHCKVEF